MDVMIYIKTTTVDKNVSIWIMFSPQEVVNEEIWICCCDLLDEWIPVRQHNQVQMYGWRGLKSHQGQIHQNSDKGNGGKLTMEEVKG